MCSSKAIAYSIGNLEEFKSLEIIKAYLNYTFYIFILILYRVYWVLRSFLDSREIQYYWHKRRL